MTEALMILTFPLIAAVGLLAILWQQDRESPPTRSATRFHVIWHRSGHIEQRCERAAGHDGPHQTTVHLKRRGKPRGPWVKEWGP